MLIGFKVKNYLSFDELQYFSMVSGRTKFFNEHCVQKKNIKLLKFSAIYGSNASGKSNLIKSIMVVKRLIRFGIDSIYKNQYFKLKPQNADIPSYFEYEIEKKDKLYSYGFEVNVNKGEIVSEWLMDMTTKTPKKIFERDCIKKTIVSDLSSKQKEEYNKLDVCIDDMKNNVDTLFIKEMYRRLKMNNNISDYFSDFIDVFNFLNSELQIIFPNQDMKFKYNNFSFYKKDINKILRNLDLGIEEIVEEETNIGEIKEKLTAKNYDELQSILTSNEDDKKFDIGTLRIENCFYVINKTDDDIKIKKISMLHKSDSKILFEAYEESDGTLRILELIDILLSDNKVFIIDEIDRSLHPILTIAFIKEFLKSCKDKNIQLIITTHEDNLLDYKIVRRDEVWFTDKDEESATTLYSLEQFKDDARFDRRIDKAYLEGRFGAVPKIYKRG